MTPLGCLSLVRTRWWRFFAAAAVASFIALGVQDVAAQARPGTISGIVRDSAGRPLENAVIGLDPSGKSRATRADARGRFRFDRVSAGKHELRTTWLGYQPDDRTVDVPDEGLDVTIVLTAIPFPLDTLVVVAKRTGAFGTVVVHNDLRPLGAVQVAVAGTRFRKQTGSDGRFSFPDLKEGGYLVEARRDGFKTMLLPSRCRARTRSRWC